MENLISVLLPVKNASDTLQEALDSLWNQTLNNFEVIAVDDHSNDDSLDLLRREAAKESRLQVHTNPGQGIVSGLETARRLASGPYLARMDADDIAHRDRFYLQRRYLEGHPDVAVVGSKVSIFPRQELGEGWRRYETWLNQLLTPQDHHREIFVESPLAHPSVLMRTDAIEDVGGYQDCPWAEDYDLWLRLHAKQYSFAKVNRILLGWRNHPHRLSMVSDRYSVESFLRVRVHYLSRMEQVQKEPILLWGAGKTGRRVRRLLDDAGVAVAAVFEVDETKIGSTLGDSPIRSYKELPEFQGPVVLVAVGAPGARAEIRPEVQAKGYIEGETAFFMG